MRWILAACLLALAFAEVPETLEQIPDSVLVENYAPDQTFDDDNAPTCYKYHSRVGIKEAARIKAIEEAGDFDGSRIVGGSPSALGVHPHLVGIVITLVTNQQSVCTGSLLSNTRVVTAAHCWNDGWVWATRFEMVLGSATLFHGGIRQITTRVERHRDYWPTIAFADIAMVTINWVGFTNTIRPIALASGSSTFAGVNAQIAGFGRINPNPGPLPQNHVQHHVTVQVISNSDCVRSYPASMIHPSTICTSGAGGRNVCNGDSGGPVQVNNQLIGVISFGHSSGCLGGHPSGHMRVTSFNAWLRARM